MTNAEFKTRARADLKGYYWLAFLTTFIYTTLSGLGNSIGQRIGTFITGTSIDYQKYIEYMSKGDSERAMEVISEAYNNPVASMVTSLITLIVVIFVINHLSVGHKIVYLNASDRGSLEIGDLFAGFKHYGKILKTMFFYVLYIYLWSLLFIIPGIVKSYSYYMVPYIMAENPNISTQRAFEISKKTMNGEKGKAFYMHLSFIGWYILGFFACCIGIYFVNPYALATYTQFYKYVKSKALATGIATPEDFAITAA